MFKYLKNDYPGGKITQLTGNSFRFDAGPSLFTMPNLVTELFEICGKKTSDYFNYDRLNILCNYFYEDGTKISANSDIPTFAKEMSEKTSDSAESVKKHLEKSAFIYDATEEQFLNKSLHKISSFLSFSTLKSIFKLPFLKIFSSMNQVNEKAFKDSKTIRIFNRYATYNGSNPYKAPGILNIIPHLEFGLGAYLPKGGMHEITNSLVQLAKEIGVKFHFNTCTQKLSYLVSLLLFTFLSAILLPMLIVISPAKTLDFETPSHTTLSSQPEYLSQSQALIDVLAPMAPQDIAQLMKLSDKLAALNTARYGSFSTAFTTDNAKQAILAFKGDVYTGLEANTLTQSQLTFSQSHLRILSGLYGLLKPLDLMQAYRLEMGTKLATPEGKDLYEYWGNSLTEGLNALLGQDSAPVLINLASNEYFKAIKPQALNARIITPVFKDRKNGNYKIISFFAKKARGMMTRYIIENELNEVEKIKHFDQSGYYYSEEQSTNHQWVFLREEV